MNVIYSVVIGYLLGSLSPSALLSKIKRKNLRDHGTGNLGATNTLLVLGKWYGIFVMFFDIFKAVVAVKIAQILFPRLAVAGLIAGGSAVVGHIYPFYLNFKGGKGLASFGGLVLGTSPLMFVILLTIALVLMFIINYTVAVPISAAILFPILYGIKTGDLVDFLIALSVSVLIIANHIPNIRRVRRGDDVKMREFVKERIFHR